YVQRRAHWKRLNILWATPTTAATSIERRHDRPIGCLQDTLHLQRGRRLMRFKPLFAPLAAAVPVALREIERPDVVDRVLAPDAWTDVQVETWLDWAAASSSRPDLPLNGAVHDWAARLAAAGQNSAVFANAAEGARFEAELTGAVLLGLAAVSDADMPAVTSLRLDLSEPEAERRLAQQAAAWRRERLAGQAAEALAQALANVADAVARCEGDAAACADPASNPALTRAAHV